MFVIDDLLSAPGHVVAFVLRNILTVKKFSSVRSARLTEAPASPTVGDERDHVSLRQSADGAAGRSDPPRQQNAEQHRADHARFGPRDG
ncbi:protein of unknown function (plasmid) [Methylocella tundrae]|uniref:Uncharacterized protein n=1 Tax=Methylocella tundrae TaxID=227605 RepID=A0A4U8Z7I9_METTU|nr:protein of unknown function [Methylocella tundrae]